MNREQDNEFEDPALKAALRRSFAGERAPESLRQRVLAALRASQATDTDSGQAITSGDTAAQSAAGRGRRLLRPLAAAAILVFGLSMLSYQLWETFKPGPPLPEWGLSIEPALAQAMVESHSACAATTKHHAQQFGPSNDFGAIKTRLSEQLSRPAVAPPLPGWTFRGAGLCDVGEHATGHLFYTRGDARLSLFILPTPTTYGSIDGKQYDVVHDEHAIAGFVHGASLICLVGSSPSGSVSLKDVKRLRDEIKAQTPSSSGCESTINLALIRRDL